jgi:hypothetical protein
MLRIMVRLSLIGATPGVTKETSSQDSNHRGNRPRRGPRLYHNATP